METNNLKFHIRQATAEDCLLINNLASQIWEPTYKDILSSEQLEWMFDWMYSIESLKNQMKSGHTFFILYKANTPVGYISVEKENIDRYHLQKIYVIPSEHGKGFGRILLEYAEKFVREQHSEGIVYLALNVNRNNKAKFFYEKQGFSVESEGDFSIGNGYFMNDYIMVKELK